MYISFHGHFSSVYSMLDCCIKWDLCQSCVYTGCHMHLYSIPGGVCLSAVMPLWMSYQSPVNLSFNIHYLSQQKPWHLHWPRVRKKSVQCILTCMHTCTHIHWHAELYSWSGYKYLLLFLHLIFISSNRAHNRQAVGWWGNPETKIERTRWLRDERKQKGRRKNCYFITNKNKIEMVLKYIYIRERESCRSCDWQWMQFPSIHVSLKLAWISICDPPHTLEDSSVRVLSKARAEEVALYNLWSLRAVLHCQA